ncbi:hypothetical protein [Paenibacillus sp. LC231]|uniref:hypothetical protein n=1 Tax=Paenibacillus sp. LC231 TaxID=1120679 RepID=UPI001F3EB1B5|nr:hypothetical protein [Paenibacillus sp. LC231]
MTSLVLSALCPDSRLNLPQDRLGHIADGCAQMRKSRKRVEIPDTGQVIGADVMSWLLPAANHCHVGNGVLRGFPKQQLHMRGVQFFEQAIVALGQQHLHIIGAVILHGVPRRSEQGAGQLHARLPFVSKGVLQRFKHSLHIRLVHAPQRHGAGLAALRIRYVKHMAQPQAAAPILNQRYALRAAFDPTVQLLVPYFNRGTGGSVRALRID